MREDHLPPELALRIIRHADQDLHDRPLPSRGLRRHHPTLDQYRGNKTVFAYKQVPQEVLRRLCNAPNPTTYWEDRIAEEYPKGVPMSKAGESTDTAHRFQHLFGGGD